MEGVGGRRCTQGKEAAGRIGRQLEEKEEVESGGRLKEGKGAAKRNGIKERKEMGVGR